MLRKLFRHDMKQMGKTISPILLLTVAISIFGSVALKINTEFIKDGSSIGSASASAILYLLFGLSVFAMFALAVVGFILILSRYYQNFFTDEGYLTFTLPVKTRSLLFSKMWASALWTLILLCVAAFGGFILAVFGTAPAGQAISHELLSDIAQFFGQMFRALPGLAYVSGIALAVCVAAELFFSLMLIFLGITIGCIVAKKHKVIASIGFVYLLNIAVSTVSVIIATVTFSTGFLGFGLRLDAMAESFDTATVAFGASAIAFAVFAVYYAALAIAGFAVNNHLLKTKFNLS